jgi:hypothetical protein
MGRGRCIVKRAGRFSMDASHWHSTNMEPMGFDFLPSTTLWFPAHAADQPTTYSIPLGPGFRCLFTPITRGMASAGLRS